MRRSKKQNGSSNSVLLYIASALALVLLASVILYVTDRTRYDRRELESAASAYQEAQELRAKAAMIRIGTDGTYVTAETGRSAYDVINGGAAGKVLLDPQGFADQVNLISAHESATGGAEANVTLSLQLEAAHVLLLQFTASAEQEETLTVSFDKRAAQLQLNSTPVTYFLPLTSVETLSRITMHTDAHFVPTKIEDVYLIDFGSVDPAELKIGVHTRDAHEETALNAALLSHSAEDCVVKGDILYTLSGEQLSAYDLSQGTPALLSSIPALGPTERLACAQDRDLLFVTAEHNGMYLIDISDPAAMRILSHYDTLGPAYGVFPAGSCAFVCNRNFGVEIVDISDPAAPVYLAAAADSADYRDCFVDGAYLYAAATNHRHLAVYDLKDLRSPKIVSRIQTDGAPQGVAVKDGLLYAATALNAAGSEGGRAEYASGMGNGMEIWDVSAPGEPVLLSRVKADGRCNLPTDNGWDVEVSGGRAYLSAAYNGLYVYDVSDPAAPKCLRRFARTVAAGEAGYRDLSDGSHVWFWDASAERKDAIGHIALTRGAAYLAGDLGIYRIADENAAPAVYEIAAPAAPGAAPERQLPRAAGYSVAKYTAPGSVWAAVRGGGRIYVAAGDGGIRVLDEQLNEKNAVITGYPVRDVIFRDGVLFTAEGVGGVAAYRAEGDGLQLISSRAFEDGTLAASSIELSADGRFLAAQLGTMAFRFLSVSPEGELRLLDVPTPACGAMFHRNLCIGSPEEKYLGVFGSTGILWYETDGAVPRLAAQTGNPYYTEVSGMAAAGEYCVAITEGGYRFFAPGDGEASDLTKLPDKALYGRAACDGKTLVVTQPYSGSVTFADVSAGVDAPVSKAIMNVEGNPDVAFVSEDMILLPCRHGGLLQFIKNS